MTAGFFKKKLGKQLDKFSKANLSIKEVSPGKSDAHGTKTRDLEESVISEFFETITMEKDRETAPARPAGTTDSQAAMSPPEIDPSDVDLFELPIGASPAITKADSTWPKPILGPSGTTRRGASVDNVQRGFSKDSHATKGVLKRTVDVVITHRDGVNPDVATETSESDRHAWPNVETIESGEAKYDFRSQPPPIEPLTNAQLQSGIKGAIKLPAGTKNLNDGEPRSSVKTRSAGSHTKTSGREKSVRSTDREKTPQGRRTPQKPNLPPRHGTNRLPEFDTATDHRHSHRAANSKNIFGSRTQARRLRKGRGLAAVASSMIEIRDQPLDRNLEAIVLDALKGNNDPEYAQPCGSDDIYRKLIGNLPPSWSCTLIDCERRDERPHRVLYLWNAKDLKLWIYDTDVNALCGSEIESKYHTWEFKPASFERFLQNESSYPGRREKTRSGLPFGLGRRR